MKLYIPEIGDILTLSNEWSCKIRQEYRNNALLKKILNVKTEQDGSKNYTFKKGDQLKVDRIYVRKGAAEYSSISFIIHKANSKIKGRFWVKLDEANSIEFDQGSVEKSIKLQWGYSPYERLGLLNVNGMWSEELNSLKSTSEFLGKVIEGQNPGVTRFKGSLKRTIRDATDEEVKEYNSRRTYGALASCLKKKDFIFIEKNEYTLIDVTTNEEIGTWKTIDSLKTNARKILKKENALK